MSSTAAITTKSLNVTSWVADDVSKGASNTQFRFCFEEDTDGDGVQDFVQLASATGKPQLVVTYNP